MNCGGKDCGFNMSCPTYDIEYQKSRYLKRKATSSSTIKLPFLIACYWTPLSGGKFCRMNALQTFYFVPSFCETYTSACTTKLLFVSPLPLTQLEWTLLCVQYMTFWFYLMAFEINRSTGKESNSANFQLLVFKLWIFILYLNFKLLNTLPLYTSILYKYKWQWQMH